MIATPLRSKHANRECFWIIAFEKKKIAICFKQIKGRIVWSLRCSFSFTEMAVESHGKAQFYRKMEKVCAH